MNGLAKMFLKLRVVGFIGLSVLLAASVVGATQGRELKVTVNYTGSGEVSESNAIFLAVWDTPNLQGGAIPIGTAVATKNGDSVMFEDLTASTVYVSGLYDEEGGWTGTTAPPSGTPAGMYTADGFTPSAIEVGDGQTVEIDFSFNDGFRMP